MSNNLENILNTNVFEKKQNEANNINLNSLLKILKSQMNTNFNNLKYLGSGLHGDLYLVNTNNNEKFICKCFNNEKDVRRQINNELSILRIVQEHELSKFYINPCYGSNINLNHIVCLFPRFNGVPLKNVLDTIFNQSFNKKHRHIILKFIIKEMIYGLHLIHERNISHMNIDLNSILVETHNINKKNLNNSKNQNTDYSKTVNDNLNTVHPTNKHIYKPNYDSSDKLLQIKFTNFGNSFGKSVRTDITKLFDNERNDFKNKKDKVQKYIYLNNNKFQNLVISDEFIKRYLYKKGYVSIENDIKKNIPNSESLKLGQLYDLYCLGRLILYLIIKNKKDISKIDVLNLSNVKLLDKSFQPYLEMLNKYIFVKLKDRKKLKFIRDMIIIRVKY